MSIDRRAALRKLSQAGMVGTAGVTGFAGLTGLSPFAAANTVEAAGSGEITIFEAKNIVTMERALPQARFMACADGKILGLGQSLDDLTAWSNGRIARIDRNFADKTLFPGLIDPHIHPMQAAVMMDLPFLAPDDWTLPSGHWPGIQGQAAYRARLKKLIEEDQSDLLICWGHHELFHGPLTRTDLDAMEAERPVIVWQRSFHEIICNSAAMRWMKLGTREAYDAAITAAKADPHHSSFDKGIFSESGLLIAIAKLQPVLLSPKRLNSGFAGLKRMMRARGVTTAADMATGIFASFDKEAALIAGHFGAADAMARVLLMPIASEIDHAPDLDQWMGNAQKFTNVNVLLDRRVKLFVDGAFFAQNMRMGAPGYSDGHIGKWMTAPENLKKQLRRYWGAGFSLHIHVNGDEGAEVLLDALGALPPSNGQDITLEHLGYCTEAQARRIAEMELMVSAQPNYIRVLGKAYSDTGLGSDRASQMNRLGSLEAKEVPLGLHSDFNMAPIDPFYLAWIAEQREGIDGVTRAPSESLSRDKALRAITIEAAQVTGMDSMVGSLSAGKKADFVVLDDDPHKVEAGALKNLPIHATIFEGTA